MQAALKTRFGVKAKLVAGHGGTFLVTLDGQEIFDKHGTGRFPEEQEILEKIDSLKS